MLINNAGALWWKFIIETPKRYDLINDINVRGSYILSHLCLPYMEMISVI